MFLFEKHIQGHQEAQRVKVLAAKPNNLSSVLDTHNGRREPTTISFLASTHVHRQTNTLNKEMY